MFFSNGQRCLTCQHAYVGLSAVCTVCPLPLAAPSAPATIANNKKWRVANSCAIKCKKGIGNLGHCGGHRNAHYALIERRRLKLLPRNGNGIVPQKLKLCKQQQSRAARGVAERGIGTGVGNVTGNGQQSFNINAIYSSNFAFYVRAQYLTRTHTRTHACVCMYWTEKSCARSCRIMPYWGSLGCLGLPGATLSALVCMYVYVCVCTCGGLAATSFIFGGHHLIILAFPTCNKLRSDKQHVGWLLLLQEWLALPRRQIAHTHRVARANKPSTTTKRKRWAYLNSLLACASAWACVCACASKCTQPVSLSVCLSAGLSPFVCSTLCEV